MKKLTLLFVLFSLFIPVAFAGTSFAATCPTGTVKETIDGRETCVYQASCPPGQVRAQDSPNTESKYVCCPSGTQNNATKCFFSKYINPAVKILSVLVGIAVVFGVASGGIQYAASGGDPQKTAKGKAKVVKSLYGLVGFMFLFSALQFLSPGGFSSPKAISAGAANAQTCSNEFLGLKPWFAYLPKERFGANCQIQDFNLLGNGSNSDLAPVALAIVDDLIRIAALVAVVFVVVGGIKYVTSQGEPDGTKSAKDSIINAIIGLVIALVAASVVSFIGNQLQK